MKLYLENCIKQNTFIRSNATNKFFVYSQMQFPVVGASVTERAAGARVKEPCHKPSVK